MPGKERLQAGLAALEKSADHEREESREQKKYHDEHVSDGGGEIADHLAFRDRE